MMTFAEFVSAVQTRVVETIGRSAAIALNAIVRDDELELRLGHARVRLIYVSSSNALLVGSENRKPARSLRLDGFGVEEAATFIANVLLRSWDDE